MIRRWAVVASLVLTASCFPGAIFPAEQPLPTASATLHWATIEMPRGSYCWKSGGHGGCADSADADTLLETGYLEPYRTAGGFDVTISFHSAEQPANFDVKLLLSPDRVVGHVMETGIHTFNLAASPPAEAGTYVYGVSGKWPEGDASFFLAIDLVPGVA